MLKTVLYLFFNFHNILCLLIIPNNPSSTPPTKIIKMPKRVYRKPKPINRYRKDILIKKHVNNTNYKNILTKNIHPICCHSLLTIKITTWNPYTAAIKIIEINGKFVMSVDCGLYTDTKINQTTYKSVAGCTIVANKSINTTNRIENKQNPQRSGRNMSSSRLCTVEFIHLRRCDRITDNFPGATVLA